MSKTSERIRMKRLEKGLTMEELGNKLGVKASAINKYEKGIVENIKRPTIEKMAEIFECSPIWLMGMSDLEFDMKSVSKSVATAAMRANGFTEDEINDFYFGEEARKFYMKYLTASKKTRKIIDELLEEGDD